ncbi:hypothetical protein EPD60_12745 [Flaviaesturariibacter flavus]|uniref:Uncharacterized protein n=1 Tax=Flaviaesturariibacter flavus TaxID=2502780 RepID=A0A4R1B976_9BACT|nr:G8 domain-containing protein [Flaviaesturariibacter flavus]TCJ13259.1 hypothetical protein EPD60_12745 [Flaviaesturariibacter flavus]
MKQFSLTLLAIIGFAIIAQARILTAANNGDWATASTWSPAVVPNNNDTVVVPQGKTVSITNNQNMNNEYMLLRVMGKLAFVGNGSKLKVNGSSAVLVYPGGMIDASSNSQSISIGNTDVLKGNDIAGGSTGYMATSTSNGFQKFNFNTLPVRFVAFTATRHSGDVLLQWTTAQEVNAFSFEVEASTDGRNWVALATIKAAGTTSLEQNYSFLARNSGAGSIQFRIKQIDLDGKFMYTAARIVKGSGEAGEIKVAASAGRVVLQFGQEVKGATVRILGLNGQVLQEQKLGTAIGQVLVPTTQKGICLVAVVTENEVAAAQKVLL